MADVTFKRIDEMETLYHGVARRARAELGVTGWGMQVYELRRIGTGTRITPTTRARRRRVKRRSTSRSRARRR